MSRKMYTRERMREYTSGSEMWNENSKCENVLFCENVNETEKITSQKFKQSN